MMKVAIPHWHDRISPVFDVAGNVLLVEINHGQEQQRQSIALTTTETQARAILLAKLDVDILICGAISQPLEMALLNADVEVIAHICGDVECVLTAFIERKLDQDTFLMPGCCHRRRRSQGRRHQNNPKQAKLKNITMKTPHGNGTGPRKQNPGTGRMARHRNGNPPRQSNEKISQQGLAGRRRGGHGRRHCFFATGLTGQQLAEQLNQQAPIVEPQTKDSSHRESNIMRVDPDLCMGCGACVRFCSANAITLEDMTAIIDPTKCFKDADCVDICPTNAISCVQP